MPWTASQFAALAPRIRSFFSTRMAIRPALQCRVRARGTGSGVSRGLSCSQTLVLLAQRFRETLHHLREILHRVQMHVNQFERTRLGQIRQLVGRERVELLAAHALESRQRYLLARLELDLRLHRLEQVELA